jgi:hypothetical protein
VAVPAPQTDLRRGRPQGLGLFPGPPFADGSQPYHVLQANFRMSGLVALLRPQVEGCGTCGGGGMRMPGAGSSPCRLATGGPLSSTTNEVANGSPPAVGVS